MSRILYFTSWYHESHDARRAELAKCVSKCITSPDIDHVFLLCEKGAVYPWFEQEELAGFENSGKLVEVSINVRPTYRLFFEYMRKFSQPGDVAVLANTDIYPDSGIRGYLQNIQLKECYALSRWDVKADGSSVHFSRRDSQDVWVFRSELSEIRGADFSLGVAGCDNKIAMDIFQSGYRVTNPSRSLKFHHLHLTNIRHYDASKPIPAPYHLIEPSFLPQHSTLQ